MAEGRVLLVESEAEVRDVLRRVLERRGYAVSVAATSAEGVAAMVRDGFGYDVVLLRMTMADGRAGEVVEITRRAPEPGPALVLSGSEPTAQGFRSRFDCDGATFLIKPFSARDLISTLRTAIEAQVALTPEPIFEASVESLIEDAPPSGSPLDRLNAMPAPPEPVVGVSVAPAAGLVAHSMPPPAVLDDVFGASPFGEVASPPPMSTPAPPARRTEVNRTTLDTDEPHGLLAPEPDGGQGAAPDEAAPFEWPTGPGGAEADYDPAEATLAPRADTQVLLRDAALFPAVMDQAAAAPEEGARVAAAAAAEDVGVQTAAYDEDERQFQLQPMSGDGTEAPRGTYGALSLPELLFAIYRDMFTGQIVLERGAVKKVVLLAGGRPVGAQSNIRSEALGHMLLQRGVIDEAQQRESLALGAQAGIRQGEALVRLGALNAEGLAGHLRAQTEERILNCFTWIGAQYGMIYDPSVQTAQDGYEINPLQLVFAGTFSAFPVGPMLQHFDRSPRKRLERTPRLADYRGLLRRFETQVAVADLCDGARTFGEIVALSPLGLVDTVRALRALELLHCVRFADEALQGEPSASEGRDERARERAGRSARVSAERRAHRRHSTGGHRIRAESTGASVAERPTVDGARRRATTSESVAPRGAERSRPTTSSPGRSTRPGVYRSGRSTRGSVDRTPTPSANPRRAARVTTGGTRQVTGARTVTASTSTRQSTGGMSHGTGNHRRVNPTPPPGESLNPTQLKKRLLSKHAAMGEQNHYEVLEVELNASTETIRAAYQQVSRLMHQAAARDHRLVEKATEVGRRLAESASVLTDPRRKAEYDAIHVRREAGSSTVEPDAARARTAFDRGSACLDREDYAKAFEHFENSSRFAPDEPIHRMFRAFAKFKLSYPKHRQAALDAHEELKRALLEDSTCDDGFVLMAHLYKATGNVEMAVKFYRKALSLNRRNRAATDALARLASDGTPAAEAKDAGLFGKLFKR